MVPTEGCPISYRPEKQQYVFRHYANLWIDFFLFHKSDTLTSPKFTPSDYCLSGANERYFLPLKVANKIINLGIVRSADC
jgi:hypothetical protein